jgi:predicted aspartyl protease
MDKSIATKGDTVRIANDALEYEVIIIDAGFNSWLVSRAFLETIIRNLLETKIDFISPNGIIAFCNHSVSIIYMK